MEIQTKYHNEIIKLTDKQSEHNEVYIRYERIKEIHNQKKNLIIVNQKDQQCLITHKELLDKGREIEGNVAGIKVHNFAYKFKVNTNILDEDDINLLKRFHFSWYNLFHDYVRSDKFLDMVSGINKKRQTTNIFPSKENIFKAYQSNYNNIRVVMVGQDPFPSAKSKANGLAFATDLTNNEHKPYALKQIEKAIKQQMNYPDNFLLQNDLDHWVKQGIMLLNTSLTVDEDDPGSHFHYWKEFIQLTFELLDQHKRKLVFVFLGSQAQRFKTYVNPLIHTVIEREHPTAGFYSGGDWKSNDLFKEINLATQIKWI